MKVELRARAVRMFIFDVDGVLTDGHIFFGQQGELMKSFHVEDGLGITLAHRLGFKTAVITGRQSEIVRLRAGELAIGDVCQAAGNKVAVLNRLIEKHGLSAGEICYTGDDLNDLAVMGEVGLACAVANARPEVKAAAHFVSRRAGGRGAVRDIIEMVLKAQDRWGEAVDSYSRPSDLENRQ